MSDLWSDKNLQSYLCLTAHWIARNKRTGVLELKSALIAFHNVTGRHDGVNLGRIMVELLDCAGITAMVSLLHLIQIILFTVVLLQSGHWTLDNAENNVTMMVEIARLLTLRGMVCHFQDNRIM